MHYHELALKGRNRPLFVRRLAENLLRVGRPHGVRAVYPRTGRIVAELRPDADRSGLERATASVFGVANFSWAWRVPASLDVVIPAVLARIEVEPEASNKKGASGSFRIATRRGDKTFPLDSVEINRRVGAEVKAATGMRVDLENADLVVHVEVLPREILFHFGKLPGPGGLPVGVAGRVVALLSGGIDSPVAAYRMMKRGCEVTFCHFHGHPFLSRASQEKAIELARILGRLQRDCRVYLVAFGEAQREVVLAAPPALRVVLYRRLMVRIAEEIARRERAGALVTGESLGQVASQTLENLTVINQVATLPVLRPLIGHDKDEIIEEARAIGTYEVSIEPDQDCCQLFVPKHPATRASLEEVLRAESRLDVAGLVKQALDRTEFSELG